MFGLEGGALGAAMIPVSLGVNLGTSYMNNREQARLNERQEANAWDMFNTSRADAKTAFSDRAKDMESAGYNPILGMQSGAAQMATGSPSTGAVQPLALPDLLGSITQLAGVANSKRQLDQQDEKIKIDKLNAVTDANYKGILGRNEKYGIKGMIGDFFQEMKNEKGEYLNIKDLMGGLQQLMNLKGVSNAESLR